MWISKSTTASRFWNLEITQDWIQIEFCPYVLHDVWVRRPQRGEICIPSDQIVSFVCVSSEDPLVGNLHWNNRRFFCLGQVDHEVLVEKLKAVNEAKLKLVQPKLIQMLYNQSESAMNKVKRESERAQQSIGKFCTCTHAHTRTHKQGLWSLLEHAIILLCHNSQ